MRCKFNCEADGRTYPACVAVPPIKHLFQLLLDTVWVNGPPGTLNAGLGHLLLCTTYCALPYVHPCPKRWQHCLEVGIPLAQSRVGVTSTMSVFAAWAWWGLQPAGPEEATCFHEKMKRCYVRRSYRTKTQGCRQLRGLKASWHSSIKHSHAWFVLPIRL